MLQLTNLIDIWAARRIAIIMVRNLVIMSWYFFALDNCIVLPLARARVVRCASYVQKSRVESGGYLSVTTNIHRIVDLATKKGNIIKLVTQQLVHTLTETLSYFKEISSGPSSQPHPSQALHSFNHPLICCLPQRRSGWKYFQATIGSWN